MLTLYFSPGACSLASHIGLEESGASCRQSLMGDQFTVADGYALVFYGWGLRANLPVSDLKSYAAWKDRIVQRPAVRKVLEEEKNVILEKR